jgi:hypothetical protein
LKRAGWKSQTTIEKPDHDAKSAAALSASGDKKPSKTMRFQGLDVWLRGQDLNL